MNVSASFLLPKRCRACICQFARESRKFREGHRHLETSALAVQHALGHHFYRQCWQEHDQQEMLFPESQEACAIELEPFDHLAPFDVLFSPSNTHVKTELQL